MGGCLSSRHKQSGPEGKGTTVEGPKVPITAAGMVAAQAPEATQIPSASNINAFVAAVPQGHHAPQSPCAAPCPLAGNPKLITCPPDWCITSHRITSHRILSHHKTTAAVHRAPFGPGTVATESIATRFQSASNSSAERATRPDAVTEANSDGKNSKASRSAKKRTRSAWGGGRIGGMWLEPSCNSDRLEKGRGDSNAGNHLGVSAGFLRAFAGLVRELPGSPTTAGLLVRVLLSKPCQPAPNSSPVLANRAPWLFLA